MKKTIKNKLLTSYLAITMITIVLIITVLHGFIYFKKTNATIDSATKLSKIMGVNLAASLSFDDKNSAENILKSLQIDNSIDAAFVYDRNDQLFISRTNNINQNEAIKKLDLLRNNSVYHDMNTIIVSSQISLDNETIGKLILIYNTDDVKFTLIEMLQIVLLISILIVLIMFKIASILQKRLTAPIYTLVNTMENILENNNYTKRIDEKSDDEFQTVFDGFNTMLNKIQKNKSELESLANIDALTGLYNRRYFFELVNQFLDMTKRENKISTILMLDIDNFKNINDTYGHNAGDLALQGFAKVLVENNRKGDAFARFGGEEFIVFLPNLNDDNAFLVAEKIRSSVETFRGVKHINFTVSIGLCEFHHNLDHAIKNADIALYKAKGNGRNRVERYSALE
ncbi:MAG: diguanylate cyclase [Pseudomonadota bacterium]